MKKKFTFLIAAIALLCFLAVPMGMWGQTTVTYAQTSTSAVSVSKGTAPTGSSASFSTTYTNMNQLTASNSMTLTLSGYEGYKITGITLSMKSNTSKGGGSLSVLAGTTEIASIADSKFNTNNWHGSWSTSYVDINVTMKDDSYEIQEENVVITISATESSLYCQSFTLTYEAVSGGGGQGSSTQILTFPFTSNISGWPTTSSTSLTNYTYTLNNVAYTFALKNVKCNGTYLMVYSVGVVGLPAIEGYKLTKVVAHNSTQCSQSTRVGISSSSSSASYITGGSYQTWTTRDSDYTYTLTSTEANTMYYMYVTNANAQVTSLELTYEYVAPSAVATPTFSLDGGYFVGNQSVIISCETAGATIYYTTDGTTPSASNGTQETSVSISTTTTLKAIAIKGEDSSSVAEATYTILTPLTTMQDIFDANTTSTAKKVAITFGNWVITGNNGGTPNKAWLTDNNGKGCSLYQTNIGFIANNVLTGTVICDLARFGNSAQISGITSSSTDINGNGIVASEPGSVTVVEDAAISALTGVNTGSVVQINNLTCTSASTTSFVLTDGNSNTITAKNTVYSSLVLEQGKVYDLTGIYELSYSTKTIYPRNASDVHEVVATTPTIYANPNSLSGFTYGEESGPSAEQTISVSGTNLEGNVNIALNNGTNFEISLSSGSGYTNSLTLAPTGGTVEATTVYVRMKAGLSIANNYSDQINLTSTNATAVAVSLAGTVTGPDVTWNLATASYSSASTTLVTWSSDYVTMTNAKGNSQTNANAYLGGGNNAHTRFYGQHVLSFTPALGYAISSIEITATDNTYAGHFTNATWDNATASNSSGIVTVIPTDGNYPVSVTIGTATRATSVTVYYEASTLTPHDITNDVDMVNGTVVATPASTVAGATVTLTIYPAAGYYLAQNSDIMVLDEGDDNVAITPVNAGTFTFTMPDEDVTVYAAFSAYSGTYYTLVNNTADLVPGRHYIIANSKTAGPAKVMGGQNGNYRDPIDANVIGNTIYETSDVREVVLSGDATNKWTLYDDANALTGVGYLYAGNNNVLRGRSDNSDNDNHLWSISISDGVATIVSQIEGDDDVTNTIKYNPNQPRFTTYKASSGMSFVYLYMKGGETDYELYSNTTCSSLTIGALDIYTVHSPAILEVPGTGTLINEGNHENLIIEDGAQLITDDVVDATIKKHITAYDPTLIGQGVSNGWHFISYPLNTNGTNGDVPNNVKNMIASTATDYDLYLLSGEKIAQGGKEWVNYKANTSDFTLQNGHGYLYANANAVDLEFAGSLNYRDPDNDFVSLDYTGWNLVGNPFAYNTYPSMSYYKMNADGTGVDPTECTTANAVPPCTGILVNSNAGSITFNKTAPSSSTNNGSVQMVLTQTVTTRGGSNAETLDNAIVSFNEGSKLEKFYFGNQNANIYIPQGNEEYAIVSTEAHGEMPVSFKANQNGQYTITVNTEDVEMGYLHLVDNMTGADIDLLATPSYTFNARTDDYTSRFKLVFSANGLNNENGNDDFAFLSNGQLIIANDGEATLQVIDITGRILSSEVINGSCSKNIDAATGVYVLRLVNGSNVKTQKVIIK